MRKCRLCKVFDVINARGLCGKCYGREARAGRILKYPKVQSLLHGIEADVAEKYLTGASVIGIASAYSVSKNTVYRALARVGVQRNYGKHTLNKEVFDILDTEEAVYWLGFLYADGHVNGKRHHLIVSLSGKDRDHLLKLLDFLGSSVEIMDFKSSASSFGVHPVCRINITNAYMGKRLEELGVVTGRGKFRRVLDCGIPSSLKNHFVRGFMDGDGYVCANDNSPLIRFSSSKTDVLSGVSDMVAEGCGVLNGRIRKSNTVFVLIYDGRIKASKVAKWIYSNASVFLERKKNNYLGWSEARSLCGENNPNSKLSWGDVENIRQYWDSGHKNKSVLAHQFGVSHRTIKLIVEGVTWK